MCVSVDLFCCYIFSAFCETNSLRKNNSCDANLKGFCKKKSGFVILIENCSPNCWLSYRKDTELSFSYVLTCTTFFPYLFLSTKVYNITYFCLSIILEKSRNANIVIIWIVDPQKIRFFWILDDLWPGIQIKSLIGLVTWLVQPSKFPSSTQMPFKNWICNGPVFEKLLEIRSKNAQISHKFEPCFWYSNGKKSIFWMLFTIWSSGQSTNF